MFDKRVVQVEKAQVRLPLYIEGRKASTFDAFIGVHINKYAEVDVSVAVNALADALGYELRAIPTGDCDKFGAIAVKNDR